jgi:UDP-glucose:(heptosyl)LPS alpha-1,3-glucosyltransferase
VQLTPERTAIRPAATGSSERPTVALVAHNVHEQGGMERACAELVRRGSASYRFVVISSELDSELRELVVWERVAVPQRPFALKFLIFAVRAGLRLRGSSVDLVHTVGAIVPNRVDIAIVHFCHAGFRRKTGSLVPPGRTMLRWGNTAFARLLALLAERWSYRPGRLDAFAAVSIGVAKELQHDYPGIPVRLVPNGVDVDRFRPDEEVRRELRGEQGVAPTDLVALFVGGDWDHKGLAIAIEGVAQASATARRALNLWVVGRGDERRFRTIAQRCGIVDQVRFFGVRSDPERLYQGSDVFVLPTLYETFSLAAFEAAASGLPVVAPAVSGIEELIGQNEGGIVVERTSQSVGDAIAKLAVDDDLRAGMGAAARRRASEYTWERSVEAILAAYSDVLGSQRRVTA